MLQPWLGVIGIGEAGLSSVDAIALAWLEQAEVLFGGQRHLGLIPADSRPRYSWPSPLAPAMEQILALRGQRVAVLASGDPLCYGIGVTLRDRLLALGLDPGQEMWIAPTPSAFSWACARLGWAWAEVETFSCCGRDPRGVIPLLAPGAKIIVLAADERTPGAIAAILQDQGLGAASLTALEHLGGAGEHQVTWLARDPIPRLIDRLHTLAITCPDWFPGPSRLAGLPDNCYIHDGQLTKQAVRACTLAALAPRAGQLLWDVGAGNGSIAIEWLRAHPRNRAIAVERHPQRLANLAANAQRLGVPQLQIQPGAAPAALIDLELPQAIFIGGGLTVPEVFTTCWQALTPGGTIVANGVTVESEQQIFQLQHQYGGSLMRLAVQQAAPLGKFLGWQALAPITQWRVQKG